MATWDKLTIVIGPDKDYISYPLADIVEQIGLGIGIKFKSHILVCTGNFIIRFRGKSN